MKHASIVSSLHDASQRALAAATVASYSAKPRSRMASAMSSLTFLIFIALVAILPQIGFAQDASSQLKQMGNQGLSWLWIGAYLACLVTIIVTGAMVMMGNAQWSTFFRVLFGALVIGASVAITQALLGSSSNTPTI